MIKLWHYRPILVLAVVCAGGTVRAQELVDALPVITDPKQAARLVLAHPAPEYPPVAKVNYLQGRVHLELTVNGKGNVEKVHVLEGNAVLAESALEATRRWVYQPLATPTGPSGFVTTVRLKFSLTYQKTRLTPRQAEQDFLRQVKPPQVVGPLVDAHPGDVVHMRLLVNDQGQVDDMGAAPMGRAQLEAARESLRGWTFRPAHWGTLPIASYLEVDVPLGTPHVAWAAPNSGSR